MINGLLYLWKFKSRPSEYIRAVLVKKIIKYNSLHSLIAYVYDLMYGSYFKTIKRWNIYQGSTQGQSCLSWTGLLPYSFSRTSLICPGPFCTRIVWKSKHRDNWLAHFFICSEATVCASVSSCDLNLHDSGRLKVVQRF